jgi:hypothetical protein
LAHGSEKLTGSERTYRIRISDYRVVYELLLRFENRRDPTRAASKRRLQEMKITDASRAARHAARREARRKRKLAYAQMLFPQQSTP